MECRSLQRDCRCLRDRRPLGSAPSVNPWLERDITERLICVLGRLEKTMFLQGREDCLVSVNILWTLSQPLFEAPKASVRELFEHGDHSVLVLVTENVGRPLRN